jgi:hypothetical protein
MLQINRLAITPHLRAPLFPNYINPFDAPAQDQNLGILVPQILSELQSNSQNAEGLELIRQFSFVNLFFFEKFILGATGPYELLDDNLGLDMCNWRQSNICMAPGARAAAFLARFHRKSTIMGHGASTWEVYRNPNIRIRIINAIATKAEEFQVMIKENIEKNPILNMLYPELCNYKAAPKWNAEGITVPNRTRTFPEPTIKAVGAGGKSAGDHHDLLLVDDIIDIDDLNVSRMGGVELERKRNWFKSNQTSLLVNPDESRIMMLGTFYAIDDLYMTEIVANCRRLDGYKAVDFIIPEPTKKWAIYYRMGIENDKPVNDKIMSLKAFNDVANEDFWTYQTQFMNNPQKSGLSEFTDCKILNCYCEYVSEEKDWKLEVATEDGLKEYWLSQCSVGEFIDPASTEKGITAKTSRSAIGVIARTYDDFYCLVWGKCGFYSTTDMFDLIFDGAIRYSGFMKGIWIESNGPQKMYIDLLKKERLMRDVPIDIYPSPAEGDKMVRIRNNFGRVLQRGKVAATKDSFRYLQEEVKAFGQTTRVDFLDMFEKGVMKLPRPFSPEEREEIEMLEEEQKMPSTINLTTGY